MSGANENTDPVSTLGSSIHLNEDDWLQLLQKLTPSSIDNLKQTLKRIQEQDSTVVSTDKANLRTPAPQVCGSTALSPASDPNTATQNTALVMSLGMPKTAIPSMITVPSVVNVTKTVSNPIQNAIVLPSSALFIAPSAQGQPISLESCIPASGINRLVVNSGALVSTTTGTISNTSSVDAFGSLNTLANAAVAVAGSASNQVHLPAGWLGTTKSSSTDTIHLPTVNLLTDSHTRPVCSVDNSPTPTRTTVDGLLNTFCGLQSADLSSQLLSGVGTSGLAVYPLQVSANGSTVFLATQPVSKASAIAHSLNMLNTNMTNAGSKVSLLSPPSSVSLASTCSPQFTSSPLTTPLFQGHALALANTLPILTSTPLNKPKFKALWESNLQGETDRITASSNNPIRTTDSIPQPTSNVDPSLPSISLSLPIHGNQSPLSAVKPIGMTPKRLAADDQTSPNQDGAKKLLLVCSQAKSSVDSGIALTPSTESVLTKALQPRTPLIGLCRSDTTDANLVHLNPAPPGECRPLQPTPILLAPAGLLSAMPKQRISEHDATPVMIDTRTEALFSKGFEYGRRLLKEEPVGEDEARRRAKRRERNRVAAARCRQRRQDQIVELQHRVGMLTKTGEDLRLSLQSLNAERSRLESLIRQHGFAGCAEAEAVLSNSCEIVDLSDTPDVPPVLSDHGPLVSVGVPSVQLEDLTCNSVSTSSSPAPPSLILISTNANNNSRSESDYAETMQMKLRPTLTKLDIRRPSLLTSSSNLLGTASTVQPTQRDCHDGMTNDTVKSAELLTPSIDVSQIIQNNGPRVSSSTSCVLRLAARPSTLIPSKLTTEFTVASSPPESADTVATATCENSDNTNTNTCVAGETPTPCFWPSDLQSFSPILTPSTWKLLKNLTSTTCSTPHSFILTPTLNSLGSTLAIAGLASPTASSEAINLFAAAVGSATEDGHPSSATITKVDATLDEQSTSRTVLLSLGNCVKPEQTDDLNTLVHH